MKRWLAYIGIFVLLAGMLSGCRTASLSDSAAQIHIGLCMSTRDDFLTSLESAAVRAAANTDVRLEVANANNDQSAQLAQIEEWQQDGYAAAIVVLCEADAAAEVIEKAGTMPVVFVNRQPADMSVLESRSNVIYIGCWEPDAGKMQGEFLASYFQVQQNKSPRIAVITGDEKTNASSLRIEAAKQALADAGLTPQYLFEESAEWDRTSAQKTFAKFLEEKPEIDAVLAANDAMGIGAAEALAQAGYAISNIPVVGVDATAEGRAAIRDGRLNFTVFQDPEPQGAGAVQAAMSMLGGTTPEGVEDSVLWIDYQPVDASNIDQLFPDD
ncbi:MAG: substrate-binding domain-containing protein [Butyricicoccus sp.]|nr:substrate-binding domain-containing protein [Butyricicoccus sp.]